jgi:2-polyprenyl-6-methoxyphenol hydroxylase-like FAD-dependent oxidoreductase
MYDAIVVGARVAGAPTAMLLARQGFRVLLVDKATFPSDAIGNNLVKPPAVAYLKRWGLVDQVVATGCPPVTRITIDYGDTRFTASPVPIDGVAEAYGPRRRVLDQLLLDAARTAGAEVREGFAVDEIVTEGERVSGIRGHANGGAVVTEQSRIVIGADGRHSLVARAVQAPTYNSRPPLACYYYSYWSDVPLDGFEGYYPPYRAIFTLPTNDGLTCVIVGCPQREFLAFRADIEGNFWQTLALVPAFAERVRSGQREERFVGAADLPNYFRKPYGPGWALVGDAGYHRDPLPAQGSSDAFRDVELLVEAVSAGLSGERPLEEGLAEYERRRNEAAKAMYELTCQRATMEPPSPQVIRLRAALQGNQAEIDRFVSVIWGTVPVEEFFAPEHIERLMSATGSAGAK